MITSPKTPVPPPTHGDGFPQLNAIVEAWPQGQNILDKIFEHEGLEGIQALAAAAKRRGLSFVGCPEGVGDRVVSVLAAVGLYYGKPGAAVMDLHFVRWSTPEAYRVPRRQLRIVLEGTCALADRYGIWIYAATTHGVFDHLRRRWGYGFELLGDYQHVNGHQYRMYLRPPQC